MPNVSSVSLSNSDVVDIGRFAAFEIEKRKVEQLQARVELIGLRGLESSSIAPSRYIGYSLPLAKNQLVISYCADENASTKKCSDVRKIIITVKEEDEIKVLENLKAHDIRERRANSSSCRLM